MAPTHANPKKPIPSKAANDKSIPENPPMEAPQVPSQSDGTLAGLSKSHDQETIEVLWQLFQAETKKKSSKKNNPDYSAAADILGISSAAANSIYERTMSAFHEDSKSKKDVHDKVSKEQQVVKAESAKKGDVGDDDYVYEEEEDDDSEEDGEVSEVDDDEY